MRRAEWTAMWQTMLGTMLTPTQKKRDESFGNRT